MKKTKNLTLEARLTLAELEIRTLKQMVASLMRRNPLSDQPFWDPYEPGIHDAVPELYPLGPSDMPVNRGPSDARAEDIIGYRPSTCHNHDQSIFTT